MPLTPEQQKILSRIISHHINSVNNAPKSLLRFEPIRGMQNNCFIYKTML